MEEYKPSMGIILRLGFAMLVALFLLLGLCNGFTLHLKRAFPLNRVNMTQLVRQDKGRHARLLSSSSSNSNGAIHFPVGGDIYQDRLYYSKVSLGTPPVDFHVQIDTCSDNLWVSCSTCKSCPKTSPIQENSPKFYNPSRSSTSSPVSCYDERCRVGFPYSSNCSTDIQSRDVCVYSISYLDQSGTSGFYVSDVLHYTTTTVETSNRISTAPVLFGCSNVRTGHLSESVQIVDGIFGFGQHGLSIISQLSSQGNSPKAFSHCLRGDSEGGGVLVLGEIVEPNMVYSPLIRNQIHYNLNLHSISIHDKILPIDPTVFSNSHNQGAMIDTGTTLAYLPDEAYTQFMDAINEFVGQGISLDENCYSISLSINNVFPSITLSFEGEADLVLSPEDYLIPDTSSSDDGMWCMGFRRDQSYTILGDLVLKNKIVVYDLVNQRIGWKSYDCSNTVNVSTTITTLHNGAVDMTFKFTLWSITYITCLIFLMG